LEKGQMRAPASIERLIRARIDQLPSFPRLVLQACALFGKHSTLSRLRDVLGTEPDILLTGLQVLEERNLIGGDAGSTCCRHALIVSAAVTTMSPVTATALAHCAAETLQRDLESSHSVAELWQCAHLWIQAGDSARAIRVVRSCASHLLAVGLPKDALDVYKEALTIFDSQDDRVVLLSGMKVPLLLTSRWRELIDTLDALVALRGPHHQASGDISDEVLRIEAYWHVCGEEEGEPLIARLLSSASSSAVMAAHRLKAVALALTIADNFCLADAMSSCYQLLRPLTRGPQIDPAFALQSDVVYHTSRGDILYAVERAQELIALGRHRADQHLLAKYLRFASVPLRRSGRFNEAEECLTEAIDISSRLGAQQAMLIALESLIIALLEQSKADEADIWLRHALDRAPSDSQNPTELGLKVLDARLALIHGRPQEAKTKLALPESALSSERMTRRRAGLASVAALVAVESSELVDLKTLQSILAESFAITAGWGGQDFTAFAHFRMVELTEGFLNAQNAAQTYLTRDRRELFPPPIEITRYLA